jgi:hypothetical protein
MTDPKTSRTGKWEKDEVALLREMYAESGQDNSELKSISEGDTILGGRSVRSLQGKLSSVGDYVVAEKAAPKPKDEGPTKGEIVTALVAGGFVHAETGASGANKDFLKEVAKRSGVAIA